MDPSNGGAHGGIEYTWFFYRIEFADLGFLDPSFCFVHLEAYSISALVANGARFSPKGNWSKLAQPLTPVKLSSMLTHVARVRTWINFNEAQCWRGLPL